MPYLLHKCWSKCNNMEALHWPTRQCLAQLPSAIWCSSTHCYLTTAVVHSSCCCSVLWLKLQCSCSTRRWSGRFYTGSWSLHAASPPQVRDQLQSKLCSDQFKIVLHYQLCTYPIWTKHKSMINFAHIQYKLSLKTLLLQLYINLSSQPDRWIVTIPSFDQRFTTIENHWKSSKNHRTLPFLRCQWWAAKP